MRPWGYSFWGLVFPQLTADGLLPYWIRIGVCPSFMRFSWPLKVFSVLFCVLSNAGNIYLFPCTFSLQASTDRREVEGVRDAGPARGRGPATVQFWRQPWPQESSGSLGAVRFVWSLVFAPLPLLVSGSWLSPAEHTLNSWKDKFSMKGLWDAGQVHHTWEVPLLPPHGPQSSPLNQHLEPLPDLCCTLAVLRKFFWGLKLL